MTVRIMRDVQIECNLCKETTEVETSGTALNDEDAVRMALDKTAPEGWQEFGPEEEIECIDDISNLCPKCAKEVAERVAKK